MTGRTHDLAAFTALSFVAVLHPLSPMSLSTLLLCLLANQIGGIAPDIDQPTAPFWHNIAAGKYAGKLFSALSGGHRFLTHSLLGLVGFAFGVRALLNVLHPIVPSADIGYVWWAFMIGMVSHLIMDSFTREGVPWLLPLPFKFGFPPVRRLRIVTGKKFESIILFPGIVVICAVLYATHYQVIVYFLKHNVS
ncbi:MAG: Membrane protein containing transrane [Candidatus Saccharibacteria bacterium]|nr:Membrane protein containing transrane [Candidatus Saccharibacteria bacterium]